MTSENLINFYKLTILKFQMFCLHNSGIFKVLTWNDYICMSFHLSEKNILYSDIC